LAIALVLSAPAYAAGGGAGGYGTVVTDTTGASYGNGGSITGGTAAAGCPRAAMAQGAQVR
jgi:hypothetical protein